MLKELDKCATQMLYPKNIKCIFCGDELDFETEESVCKSCVLPYNKEFCSRCGRHMENMATYCDVCMNKKWEFDLARSAFVYEEPIVPAIYRLKFGGEGYLAKYIASYLNTQYLFSNFVADIVTFVPIHKSRKRKRGYNQSELIAREFCVLTGLRLIESLEKHVKTKPMSKLKAENRAESIKDTMRLICDPNELKGKKIILIDDVFTSGATANESSKILKTAKPDEIMVLTFASVEIKPKDLY